MSAIIIIVAVVTTIVATTVQEAQAANVKEVSDLKKAKMVATTVINSLQASDECCLLCKHEALCVFICPMA